MIYEQALELEKKYNYIIGKEINERIITDLVIVPSDRKHDTDIIFRMYENEGYVDILSKHTDFALIILYDFPNHFRATGDLFKDTLNNVLQKLGEL